MKTEIINYTRLIVSEVRLARRTLPLVDIIADELAGVLASVAANGSTSFAEYGASLRQVYARSDYVIGALAAAPGGADGLDNPQQVNRSCSINVLRLALPGPDLRLWGPQWPVL